MVKMKLQGQVDISQVNGSGDRCVHWGGWYDRLNSLWKGLKAKGKQASSGNYKYFIDGWIEESDKKWIVKPKNDLLFTSHNGIEAKDEL